MEITDNTLISRKPEVVFNEIDGEYVMLSIDKGEYYALNEAGSRIWEIIETPSTLRTIINKLHFEFDVEEEQCILDVKEFILEMLNKDIITLS